MREYRKAAGHLALFGANTMWGIMAPVSKLLLTGGAVTATALADLRLLCGTMMFWIVSIFVKRETVDRRDYMKLFAAAFFSASLNQILFVNGVALTSPVDAGICTSTLPIWTMLLSAFHLKEKLSLWILNGAKGSACTASDMWGNILCLGSQISYAVYLVYFQDIIRKYSPLTLMKWKYLFGAAMLLPFSMGSLSGLSLSDMTTENWMQLSYVLFCGTFLSYLIVSIGQKTLRPTVVAMYNYLQPIWAGVFAIICGQDQLTPVKIPAVLLIFTGVMMVNKRSH